MPFGDQILSTNAPELADYLFPEQSDGVAVQSAMLRYNSDAISVGSPQEVMFDMTLADFNKQQSIQENLIFQFSASKNSDIKSRLTYQSQETRIF